MAFRVAGSFRYASPMVTNSSQVSHIGLGSGLGLGFMLSLRPRDASTRPATSAAAMNTVATTRMFGPR